jgi:hypothetical protein
MKSFTVLALALLFVVLLVVVPLALIWSLNALFPVLAIGYSFKTWLAAFLVSGFIGGRTIVKGK